MKKYFPTYEQFLDFNNDWRKSQKKEHQHKALIALYYPFALIVLCLLYVFIFCIFSKLQSSSYSSKGYRNSDRYRKVIKEGVFYDSVEYHER